MSNLAQLRSEHDRLVVVVKRLEEMTARPAPPPAAELHIVRRELSGTLIAHLKSEDWMLYPSLLDDPNPVVVATALRFCGEMGGLAAAFLDYAGNWNAAEIEADWPAYCRETDKILKALIQRIAREDRDLYPLLDHRDMAA